MAIKMRICTHQWPSFGLFTFWHDVSMDLVTLVMTLQLIMQHIKCNSANRGNTWKVKSNSLSIDFIHGDMQGCLCKKINYPCLNLDAYLANLRHYKMPHFESWDSCQYDMEQTIAISTLLNEKIWTTNGKLLSHIWAKWRKAVITSCPVPFVNHRSSLSVHLAGVLSGLWWPIGQFSKLGECSYIVDPS